MGIAWLQLEELKTARFGPKETTQRLRTTDGKDIGDITFEYQFSADSAHAVPDFHFLTEFGVDNRNIKPKSCGIEGWVWMKGPHDFKYEQRWMYIIDAPPAVCYLDEIESEQVSTLNYSSRGSNSHLSLSHIGNEKCGCQKAVR
jgi:hypothetical protein